MKLPPKRGRRIYIVKGKEAGNQPDFWPLDEIWGDDFTLLGVVDSDGNFVPNRAIGGGMVN